MNITFITPASKLRRLKVYQMGQHMYGTRDSITGPLILAGICKEAGHHVEAYEEFNGSFDLEPLIEKTDVLCLYTMTSTAPCAYELADLFHEKGHARVLIGGMHASAMPEEAARHADQVLVGEGEKTILDVVEGRITDKVVHCEPICDLDSIPWPDYSVLKTPVEAADIITSRGCTNLCAFCTTSRMFAPYRKRSVNSVIAEIKHYRDLGFEYMNFEDDNFTADPERVKEICRRMIDENLQFKETFFFGRTDMANDPEMLDLLAAAHCTWVLIGIESLNQESLDAINKCQDLEDIQRAGEACRDHGIHLIASLVVGLDTDSPDDLERGVEFANSIEASKLQPAILTPFPGTATEKQYSEEGRMLFGADEDWEAFDMMNATFQPRHWSPWGLQMQFFTSAEQFYNVKQGIELAKSFTVKDGVMRAAFGVVARLGRYATWAAGTFAKNSYWYAIKHADWIYADEPDNQDQRDLRTGHLWIDDVYEKLSSPVGHAVEKGVALAAAGLIGLATGKKLARG